MSIQVALHHRTSYTYDRPVTLGPQIIRLRPAPHCRTPIDSYSLHVSPENHFVNWQQDPHGNFLARIVFEEKVTSFSVDIDLIANMSVINPFDFFVEADAEQFPFQYKPEELSELTQYLAAEPVEPLMQEFLDSVDRSHERTIDFLVGLNSKLHQHIDYVVRMEPGVQSCKETLEKRSGSCRDSAWLLVQVLRQMGLAARGIWPSPVNNPLVGSSPTQPAPGRKTSVQACRSVKSTSVPEGPSGDFTSGLRCIK